MIAKLLVHLAIIFLAVIGAIWLWGAWIKPILQGGIG